MSYKSEFRLHWTTLVGAFFGLALGAAINHYMLNLFGPALIEDFEWSKAQFALVGSLSLISMIAAPLAGYFVDRFGPKTSAMIGFIAVPLSFLSFSFMSGNIYEFYGIMLFKNIFGILTTTIVFCRVVVERFDAARGLSLSILMSGAPLVGAIAVPVIGEIIDSYGWRTGYQALAVLSAIGGVIAVSLIARTPAIVHIEKAKVPEAVNNSATENTFLYLVRQPIFLMLVLGMFLVNMPQVIVSSQLKMVLFESGAASRFATLMVSVYAVSVIAGRFISGVALDNIPAHIVALFSLGLPAVGFCLLATSFDASWVLAMSVGLVGLAQGAEGDIGAFLTSRKFSLKHYSFVYGCLVAAMGAGVTVGSLSLSYTLHLTDSYNAFLLIAAVATAIGSVCFFLTGLLTNHKKIQSLK